jgi:hypothetical protein
MRSSWASEAGAIDGAACTGIGSVSLSRPRLVKTKRRSTSWHAEHMKVWCSKPGTAMVSSLTTFIKIISASQARHRIARHPPTTTEDAGTLQPARLRS